MGYADMAGRRAGTLQSEQADPRQVQNHAGGFAFTVDDWTRLERWLVLGSEGPTYYATARALTRANAAVVDRCLSADAARTIDTIVQVSLAGRAPKNDQAVFALALAASHSDPLARALALGSLARVCRIGTHLFQFAEAVDKCRGWGRGLRRAIARWYTDRSADALAHQAALRWAVAAKGHFGPLVELGPWGAREVGSKDARRSYGAVDPSALPRIVQGFELAHLVKSATECARVVTEYGLTHEMVPSQHLASPDVWRALLPHMPMGATVRNLGRMTANGALAPGSEAASTIATRLRDGEAIRKARLHPLAVLLAARTYSAGRGEKGKLTWSPVAPIVDALEDAFSLAFETVVPTGKRIMLALDVSGSMVTPILGSSLTARDASACMAMVTARREASYELVGFAAGAHGYGGQYGGAPSRLLPIGATARSSLREVIAAMQRVPMGGTDCALPMLHALERKQPVDAFVVYTDSETWHGKVHPHEALRRYRAEMGIDAKLVVVGMTATEFTIADPTDAGMLDVVGFDTAAPALIADFIRGGSVAAEEAPE
jgi:60 kDa SS-A/Ro ribonucleoprotein